VWRSLENASQMMGNASASILAMTGSSASSGNRPRARATRSRTSLAAASMSRSNVNSTVTWLTSSRLTDLMTLMPSMPARESSRGWVIWLSTTSALAPV
jgi:hypothetical protein